jgi:HEAT repeat protein
VRLLAIERLGDSGRNGAVALVHLLNDDHAGVRREAAWSLGHIGSDAWPPIKEALQDEKPRVRAGAALALANVYHDKGNDRWPSREREAIVPILSKLLTDQDPEVGRNAKEALERIER